MTYHDIQLLLERPAVRLLANPQAAFILGFLFKAFKTTPRVTWPEDDLRVLLENYLAERRADDPLAHAESPVDYFSRWCDRKHGYLRRYFDTVDGRSQPMIELSANAEKALHWLESLRETQHVGTESRLESITRELADLVRRASPDVAERKRALVSDLERIQAELQRIDATGQVESLEAWQIDERFARILATARELLGDFRQVEENFRRIGQDIAQHQARPDTTRGAVVGGMLDAHRALRESPQGRSFYAFWELLLSDERQTELRRLIDSAYAMDNLGEAVRSNRVLGRLTSRLLDEATSVSQANERMSANLRRALETQDMAERRRVRTLLGEIQSAAIACRDRPPPEDDFWTLDHTPQVYSAMSRELWFSNDLRTRSGAIEAGEVADADAHWRRLRNLPEVQLRRLRGNVARVLEEREMATLADVLAAFPPREGMVEVAGYLIVAGQEPRRHYIAEDYAEVLALGPASDAPRWRVPRVLFRRS